MLQQTKKRHLQDLLSSYIRHLQRYHVTDRWPVSQAYRQVVLEVLYQTPGEELIDKY